MLTAHQLRKLITYNPRTGVFRWKMSGGRAKNGKRAGGSDRRRIYQIRIDGRLYRATRLAWLYVTGEWPKHGVSCINRDRSDIRWANLRETTQSQRQASIAPENRLGVKGIWITKGGKFVAAIRIAGQKKYLGSFDTIQEAGGAYAKAAKNAFGIFARRAD
jgi:hypothetical protein